MRATNERELKLAADPGFQLPDLDGVPLEPRTFTSVYYDTADRSLARAHITLRRRTEHGRAVWQLKLPAESGRYELEQPGGPLQPPDELSGVLAAHLHENPLVPIAELRTLRRGVLVERDGASAEVVVDEVAVMDARRVAGSFAEVEVELVDGDEAELGEIAKVLRRAGARAGDGVPKVQRVVGRPPGRADETDDAARVAALLDEQVDELLTRDPGVRFGNDPEDVHKLRVATRRLRAILRVARPLLEDRDDAQELRAELKWAAASLGALRDYDVLLERLRATAADLDEDEGAAAQELIASLEAERRPARIAVQRTMRSRRYLELVRRLRGGVRTCGDTELGQLARRPSKKLAEEMKRAGKDPDDATLHELRKLGKRVRYAAELMDDARSREVVSCAKNLQDVLGEHQDAVVAEQRLRELIEGRSAAHGLAAGRLIERERDRREEARASYRKAWRKLDRAAARAWS